MLTPSKLRRLIIAATVLVGFALALPNGLDAARQSLAPPAADLHAVAGKIDRTVLAALQNGKPARALLVMAEQADVSAANALPTKAEKGTFVFNTLRATAERTQAPLRALLDRRGIPYRAYYVANVIALETLNAPLAAELAARPEVGRIAANARLRLLEPVSLQRAPEAAGAAEWNLRQIHVKRLWQRKIKGQGLVVANQDTGVQWTHPALKTKYRGYDAATGAADHNYNWWDAVHGSLTGLGNSCGYNLAAPCDDGLHGTHTMGTLVGRAGGNKIGVAPRAKWISCRNMDEGTGLVSTYIECFQFFLAPWDLDGSNPDPLRAPDVVSNSWYCPPEEGCSAGSLQTAVENVRAAGIFVAVAAGNSGPNCSTISDPAAIYDAATTVGATNAKDQLMSFSSRGPVTVDDSHRRKPDLTAPGANIRSSIPKNSYALLSGTSMAAPHLAGAVALLWQARPQLRGDVDATETALLDAAKHKVKIPDHPNQNCGGTGPQTIPNNLFGYGRLDVWKAYRQTGD